MSKKRGHVGNRKNSDKIIEEIKALRELGIEIICAHSAPAKGRVERSNHTHQDRLVKELRLLGINEIEAANAYLPTKGNIITALQLKHKVKKMRIEKNVQQMMQQF